MGLRFRRSIRVVPGVRLNLSRSGASVSLGGRGATLNLGRRGSRATVGLPRTGLSYTTRTRPAGHGARLGVLLIILVGVLLLRVWANGPPRAPGPNPAPAHVARPAT